MNTSSGLSAHTAPSLRGFAIRSIIGALVVLAFIGYKVYRSVNPWESLGADTTTLEPETYLAQELNVYSRGSMRVHIDTKNADDLIAHWLTEKDFMAYYENGEEDEGLLYKIKSQNISINQNEDNLKEYSIPKGTIYICFENLSEEDVSVTCEIFVKN